MSDGHILLTGGSGCMGSHVAVALAEQGLTPVILGDFYNARPSVVDWLKRTIRQLLICDSTERPLGFHTTRDLVEICQSSWHWIRVSAEIKDGGDP